MALSPKTARTINKKKNILCVCFFLVYYTVPDTSVDGVLFLIDFFVCLYVYMYLSFFVSLLARLLENGWTDLHEIFGKGVE